PAIARPWTRTLLAVPLALAVLNGLSPYLGLKTRSAWDMYSNLQMAGPQPNHLFLPHSLNILGELSAPIKIIESSNPTLQSFYIQDRYDILPFELRKIFADDPTGKTTFIWNNQRYEDYPHGSGPLALSQPPHWLLSKLLWFRKVDQNLDPRCQW
ncbi:MAG: hypothetical protein EBZ48_12615, partial [Proteobacteria bacterium]|nr:hypothetical protein [Pseudomonadota bacterium]